MPLAAADTVGVDGQTQLPLECMPSAACLQLLRVLLELLMAEIKAETKKHLMMQLQMAAAAAAGSAGVSKPDASIARPLKQVKQVIKAVHRMQLMLEFPKQLAAAADLSDLWLGASCGSNLAAMAAAVAAPQQGQQSPHAAGRGACPAAGSATKQPEGPKLSASVDMSPPSPKGLHPWSLYNLLFEENSENLLNEGVRNSLGALSLSRANRNPDAAAADSPHAFVQQQGPAAAGNTAASSPGKDSSSPAVLPYISSFPSALVAACVQHLEGMPAELPLMALQVLWDARRLLNGCGLLGQGLGLLQEQERLVTCCFMQHLVPTAYEHFKVRACRQQHPRVLVVCLVAAAPAAAAAAASHGVSINHCMLRCTIMYLVVVPHNQRPCPVCVFLLPALHPAEDCWAPDCHSGAAAELQGSTSAACAAAVLGQHPQGALHPGHAGRLHSCRCRGHGDPAAGEARRA